MNLADYKICILTAILLALSFPPFPLGILAPFALALFMNHIIQKDSKAAFRLGYVNGLFWALLTLFWIASNTFAGAVVVIFVTPLQYAVVWWLFNRIYHRNASWAIWSFPVLWVASEYLRHFSDLRFNWMNIAHTQTYYLPFIQFIEWTGYLGLVLLLGYITVFVYLIFFKRRNLVRNSIILSLLIIVPIVYGVIRIQSIQNKNYETLRVGVVQPNVDPFKKWDLQFQDSTFKILVKSTYELSKNKPELVVWPETATPFYLRYEAGYLKKVHKLVDSLGVHLITGTPDAKFVTSDDYITYNAAFSFSPHRTDFDVYNKIALVPAAESMPFKNVFPFLRKLDVGGGDFFAGNQYAVFTVKDHASSHGFESRNVFASDTLKDSEVKVSTVICYDSVFPQIVRQFVKHGARILAIITNDGWFGNTSGPYQHAQYAVLRAVENRVSIARSANTGISFFLDPTGKKHEKVGLGKRAVISYDLPITQKLTFYSRFGDWPGAFCLVISIPFIVFAIFKKI